MNIKRIITNPRTIQAMLGTSKEEFERLIPQFEQVLKEIKLSNPDRQHKIGQGIKGKLPTTEHKLFFTLFTICFRTKSRTC